MDSNNTSSRTMAGSTKAENTDDDARILAAWADRQRALTLIEQRGPFHAAETHSPAEIAIYDSAEEHIIGATASSAKCVLAQAWVAWSANVKYFTPDERRLGDCIRRAEYDELQRLGSSLDYEHKAMVGLIGSLRAMATSKKTEPRAAADVPLRSASSIDDESIHQMAWQIQDQVHRIMSLIAALDNEIEFSAQDISRGEIIEKMGRAIDFLRLQKEAADKALNIGEEIEIAAASARRDKVAA